MEMVVRINRARALYSLSTYRSSSDFYLRQIINVGLAIPADYLLLADAYLLDFRPSPELAANNLNIVRNIDGLPPLSPYDDDIHAAIKEAFSIKNRDAGMKYLNADRWGETANWGHRQILPVPMRAIEENPNLVQNPGW
jgi:hypothetical protein